MQCFSAMLRRQGSIEHVGMFVKHSDMFCRLLQGTFMSAVRALKSLQKDMRLRPACPSAGPTGGAGFAWPALMTSLMTLCTDLAFDMGWQGPLERRQG